MKKKTHLPERTPAVTERPVPSAPAVMRPAAKSDAPENRAAALKRRRAPVAAPVALAVATLPTPLIRAGMVGTMLGISPTTVYRLAKEGTLRVVAHTPGGTAMFSLAEITAYQQALLVAPTTTALPLMEDDDEGLL